MDQDRITLDNAGGGAAQEKFEQELANVLANIMDPNTDWDAKRKVVLTFTFVPNENRDMAAILIECQSKLAAQRGSSLTAFFGVDKGTGEFVCKEYDPGQMTIGEDRQQEDEQPAPRPLELKKGGKEE